jgi:YcxB-like protein
MEEQQTIKLSFVLTLADLREGLPTSAWQQRPVWRKILGTVGWLFFLLSLLGWWLIQSFLKTITPNVQPIQPRPEIDDLWLVLLPTLMPVLLIASGYVVSLLKNAFVSEGSAPAAVARRNSILTRVNSFFVMLVVCVGTWLLLHPDLAWVWTPTRPKIVIFALGPWIALFTLFGFLAPLKRRLTLRTLWNTTAVHQRPKNIEISQEGMVTIDARFSCRYRWNHFVRYSETANLLRLHMEDHRAILIPKRAVAMDDMVPLRSLICSNISEGKFIVNDPRFAVLMPQPVIPVLET